MLSLLEFKSTLPRSVVNRLYIQTANNAVIGIIITTNITSPIITPIRLSSLRLFPEKNKKTLQIISEYYFWGDARFLLSNFRQFLLKINCKIRKFTQKSFSDASKWRKYAVIHAMANGYYLSNFKPLQLKITSNLYNSLKCHIRTVSVQIF